MWENTDQLVQFPRGIAVDTNSNIYLASSGYNTILLLSSDGKQARKLLVGDARINNPFGLAFDEKKEKLLVCEYDGPILYSLN